MVTKNEEMLSDLNIISKKLSALSNLVYEKLETVETNATAEWTESQPVVRRLYEESEEDLYLIATVLSDIAKTVDRTIKEA